MKEVIRMMKCPVCLDLRKIGEKEFSLSGGNVRCCKCRCGLFLVSTFEVDYEK